MFEKSFVLIVKISKLSLIKILKNMKNDYKWYEFFLKTFGEFNKSSSLTSKYCTSTTTSQQLCETCKTFLNYPLNNNDGILCITFNLILWCISFSAKHIDA